MSRGRTINIGGDENDSSYRYKMEAIITKIEGRGNGIKTVLMNIVDVCKQLHTDPGWLTKFFGIEVGALSKFDTKRNVGIVNGVHKPDELQKALKIYINHFVLCPQCKLPELQQKIHGKKQLLIARCLGCGWKGNMKSTHRVKQYMINHPPSVKYQRSGSGKGKNVSNKQRGNRRKNKNSKTKSSDSLTNSELKDLENDENWSVDVSEEAVAKRKQEEVKT